MGSWLWLCSKHTWWERLLELLNLLGILQNQSVEVSLASDLELDLGRLLVALDACSYPNPISISPPYHPFPLSFLLFLLFQSSNRVFPSSSLLTSPFFQISQSFANMMDRSIHTGSILASCNLDELFALSSAHNSSNPTFLVP